MSQIRSDSHFRVILVMLILIIAPFVKGEVHRMLPHRKIVAGHGISNKRRRVKKPWRSDELTLLWNDVFYSEKVC